MAQTQTHTKNSSSSTLFCVKGMKWCTEKKWMMENKKEGGRKDGMD